MRDEQEYRGLSKMLNPVIIMEIIALASAIVATSCLLALPLLLVEKLHQQLALPPYRLAEQAQFAQNYKLLLVRRSVYFLQIGQYN